MINQALKYSSEISVIYYVYLSVIIIIIIIINWERYYRVKYLVYTPGFKKKRTGRNTISFDRKEKWKIQKCNIPTVS